MPTPSVEVARPARRRPLIWLVVAALVLIWAFAGAKVKPSDLITGLPAIGDVVGRMIPPDFSQVTQPESYAWPAGMSPVETLLPVPVDPAKALARQRWWDNTFPQTVVGATVQTIQMALAGTFLALLVAFPLAFLAARNTSPAPWVYRAVRAVLNVTRTVPDLALGLIFVSAVGLGAFAGTLALAVHTTTVLAKLLSESIEAIDGGVVEAIQATGAGYAQVLGYAVVPQMLPDLISFTLYRFETNIRAAAVLGLIGAGGIGQLMYTAFRQFQYREASAIVVVLIVLVISVDLISARVRNMAI